MNGEKRRRHGRSIRRRLLVPICLLLTVQVAVLIGGVYFSGLLERMDENAYAVLDQRVQSRAGYLEDDMVRRWSNLSLTQEVSRLESWRRTPPSTTRFWNRQRRNSSL